LASYFSFAYLDTGAMYRACAWWCLHRGIDLDATPVDERAIMQAVSDLFTEDHFDLSVDPQDPKVFVDGEDISDAIRSSEVSSHVSIVSNIIPVRHVLIAAQRAFIEREAQSESYSKGLGVVAEGRDITTVVSADAEVRVLLTAREEVRQARRAGQSKQGVGMENIAARDEADSKVTSFLSAADGVTTLDNSDLTFEQTVDALISLVDQAIEEQEYREYAANLEGYDLDDEDQSLLAADRNVGGNSLSGPQPVGVLAVVGRPNVGKSTLVNRILGRRVAVVEDTPGVTRDRVSYDAEWAGNDFKLVDTGGWESDVEGIESAIASQAQVAVQLSDAVIFVVDAQVGMTDTDQRIVKMLRASGKPVILAVNKIDDVAGEYMAAEFWKLGMGEPYAVSAMHGRGVGDLLDTAVETLKKTDKTSGFLTPGGLRRVALVGRPNVGKSSLLNHMARQERAVVNELAGTTRDPIDEVIDIEGEDWLFIDTAGIKRRAHKLSGAEYYSSLRTQAAIERSELALVLFDASEPVADQDLKVMSQAVDAGRAIVLVFNKWDLLDEFDRQRLERLWNTEFDRVTWAERVNLSAKTGWHSNRLAKAMRTALASWDKRIPTGKLNAFLGRIQSAHPHPLRGGKQPRVLFATQASTRPPRFVIFATGFLEHGYRRFIERSLREEFGFEGTPIQISVHIREKRKRK
jgi:GTP-binding protein